MHIFYADSHRLHATDGVRLEGHPFITEEVPARAELILAAVQDARLGPVSAPSDHGLEPILAVHDAAYLRYLQTAHAETAALNQQAVPVFPETFFPRHGLRRPAQVTGLAGYYAFGVGSPILEGTWTAAYWSAQCALSAAAAVRDGERVAYAVCRPPGHHAAADLYGGFCYLNNAAIAARYLDGRTAIVDVDYHHGNGTQIIFYEDPRVLFCSLHAHPDEDYPYYWGAADERGAGAGLGLNRNWPLPQGIEDHDYLVALDQALEAVRDFGPRYLVISAGFDIAAGDPVGGFNISRAGLAAIGARLAGLGLPAVVVQEGGYLLDQLGENAVAFLRPFG